MALGLIPEVFDAIDVSAQSGREGFGAIAPVMMETRDIQDVVAAEGIGVDDRIEFDLGLVDRQQGGGLRIGNHPSVGPGRRVDGNDLMQPTIEQRDGVLVDADQVSSRARWRASGEVLA